MMRNYSFRSQNMKFIFLGISIFLLTSVSAYSQIRIGDIKVDSFGEFFDMDSKYWIKIQNPLDTYHYRFNEELSEIWFDIIIGLGTSTEEEIKPDDILLKVRPDYNMSSIEKRLTEQFNNLFGKYKKVKYRHLFFDGVGDGSNYREWSTSEGEYTYRLILVRTIVTKDKFPEATTGLLIKKEKDIPDF